MHRIRYKNCPLSGDFLYGAACTTYGKNGSYMDDLKQLYYILLYYLGIHLPWFTSGTAEEIAKSKMKFKECRVCNVSNI